MENKRILVWFVSLLVIILSYPYAETSTIGFLFYLFGADYFVRLTGFFLIKEVTKRFVNS
jgi:hypothetical protein